MNKQEQQAEVICEYMDSNKRIYRVTEEILSEYRTKYCYLDPDLQLARVLSGFVGTDSDAYILYAVSMLGIADSPSIAQVLMKFKALNSKLPILDAKNRDQLRYRLKLLTDNGFLVLNKYSLIKDTSYGDGNCSTDVTFYSLCDSAVTFINQRFNKRLRVNRWFQAKPKQELIAVGSCAYTATHLMKTSEYQEICPGDFKNRLTNTTMFMPIEMRMKRGDMNYYIGLVPSFLVQTKVMGAEELQELIKNRLLLIRGYFEHRNTKGDPCYVIVCAENKQDFQRMAAAMVNSDLLDNYFTNIYFTGEGALRECALQEGGSVSDCIISIRRDDTNSQGFSVSSLDSPGRRTGIYKI